MLKFTIYGEIMLGSDTSGVWSNIHIHSQDHLESLYGFVKHYKNEHFRKLVDILEYYNEWFKLCFDQDNEELNKLGIQFQTKVPELQEYISDIKEEDPCIYLYLKSQNYIKEYEGESDSESEDESEFSKTYIDPMFLVYDEEETFTRDIQNGRREKKDEDEDGWTKKMIKNDKGKFEYEQKEEKKVIEKVKSENNEPYFEYIDVTEEKQIIEDDLENVEKIKELEILEDTINKKFDEIGDILERMKEGNKETEILNVLKRELDKKYKKNINEKNIGVIKFDDFSSFFIDNYEALKNHYLNLVNKEMFIRMINNKAISKIHLLNLLKGEINKYLIQK